MDDLRARVARLEERHGALALETTAVRHDLAGALHEEGHLAEAEEQYALAYEGFVRRFGAAHPFTLTCLNNLALVLRDRSRCDQALALLARVHQERAALYGPAHPLTLNAANNFLSVQVSKGELAAAAEQYPALLAACEQTFGPEDGTTGAVRRDHARVLRRLGRHHEAAGLLGAPTGWGIGPVLLGCARLLRYTGLFPVALTASRYGAELTLGTHRGGRTEFGPGRLLHDDDLGIRCEVVAPEDLEVPYEQALDLRESADQVADAVGALGEHLAEADRTLGPGRLRVRVFVHHAHWPRLSDPPSLTVDRRLMSLRDRARHDRLMRTTPHHAAPVTGRDGRRRSWLGSGGFSVCLADAPQVLVSTDIGLSARPAPSPSEA
ncbi:tetratricopeptide repeat protein [Streptomyces sp. SID2888]|uniref:tetratricopeptide repeat protein n=1 Tax=Streptomyces sp. SID2888 TaxID=2690256 RepID=UPI0031F6F85D